MVMGTPNRAGSELLSSMVLLVQGQVQHLRSFVRWR